MIGRAQFDTHGVACVFVEQSNKNFSRKYLNDPFPAGSVFKIFLISHNHSQSSLANQINEHRNAEIAAGALKTKKDFIDFLTWTDTLEDLFKIQHSMV